MRLNFTANRPCNILRTHPGVSVDDELIIVAPWFNWGSLLIGSNRSLTYWLCIGMPCSKCHIWRFKAETYLPSGFDTLHRLKRLIDRIVGFVVDS